MGHQVQLFHHTVFNDAASHEVLLNQVTQPNYSFLPIDIIHIDLTLFQLLQLNMIVSANEMCSCIFPLSAFCETRTGSESSSVLKLVVPKL